MRRCASVSDTRMCLFIFLVLMKHVLAVVVLNILFDDFKCNVVIIECSLFHFSLCCMLGKREDWMCRNCDACFICVCCGMISV